jgi:hypothetical protein
VKYCPRRKWQKRRNPTKLSVKKLDSLLNRLKGLPYQVLNSLAGRDAGSPRAQRKHPLADLRERDQGKDQERDPRKVRGEDPRKAALLHSAPNLLTSA